MNIVAITGYLGKAPKLQQTQDGQKYARLRLAVNGGKTLWVDVVVFDKLAEQTSTLAKGQKIAVFGRLDLNKQNKLVVVAREIEFLKPKKETISKIPSDDLPF